MDKERKRGFGGAQKWCGTGCGEFHRDLPSQERCQALLAGKLFREGAGQKP